MGCTKKSCVACRHYEGYGICQSRHNYEFIEIKPECVQGIEGRTVTHMRYTCSDLRDDGVFWCRIFNTCGKEGRWFERKI
jgi:uncharacterized protein YodC (DUF2158 family)